MRGPNFFIIGAPKCGTTSLAGWLSDHPQVFMSPVKEPHFYNFDQVELFRPTRAEYDALFRDAQPDHIAIGEASVWYLSSSVAVPRILQERPDAKFIVCVRNPADMAPSLHKQRVFAGTENITDFEEAWRVQGERARGMRPPLGEPSRSIYGDICRIGRQIEVLLKLVDRTRVLVVFLDDMRENPNRVYADVLRFLGLRDSHAPRFERRNPAQVRRIPWLRHILLRAGLLKRALGFRKGLGLIGSIDRWNTRESRWSVAAPLSAELREHFRADAELLSALTGRDLSSWTDGDTPPENRHSAQ
jgi:hypothetical protein